MPYATWLAIIASNFFTFIHDTATHIKRRQDHKVPSMTWEMCSVRDDGWLDHEFGAMPRVRRKVHVQFYISSQTHLSFAGSHCERAPNSLR